uniref:Tandem-hirudin variant 1 n=1 Tax=Hirudinaria manillensis TaxID=1348078 RepID=A0A977Q7Y3_HIRMN|nr:tandem-hirudin variant 1 [Hirudinaria manillensis]UXG78096.1 tandem-hirudin variant 2 [Hirudinaria manillensis]
MFSLKLFVVFVVVCISVSEEVCTVCAVWGENNCLCKGDEFCGKGKHCELNETGNKCADLQVHFKCVYSGEKLCLCEGDELCGMGKHCILGSSSTENKCETD